MILPGAQEVFDKYFLPWHDGETKPAGLRLESYVIKGMAGRPLRQYLRADYAGLLQDYLLETLPNAAKDAYQPIISFKQFDESVLASVDAYYDPQMVAALIWRSDPTDFANDYLMHVSYYAAMLAALLLQQGGYAWLCAHPYFYSVVVHPASGTATPVFDWALIRLSADGRHGVTHPLRKKL